MAGWLAGCLWALRSGAQWRPVATCRGKLWPLYTTIRALRSGAQWQPVAARCGPYTIPSGLGGRAPNGNLWRQAVAPIQYHPERRGLAGWQSGRLAGWQAGRLAGWWLAGWLDGWLAAQMNRGGRHHHCNLTCSTPNRVAGDERI